MCSGGRLHVITLRHKQEQGKFDKIILGMTYWTYCTDLCVYSLPKEKTLHKYEIYKYYVMLECTNIEHISAM